MARVVRKFRGDVPILQPVIAVRGYEHCGAVVISFLSGTRNGTCPPKRYVRLRVRAGEAGMAE
jgi:hypothetical protein